MFLGGLVAGISGWVLIRIAPDSTTVGRHKI